MRRTVRLAIVSLFALTALSPTPDLPSADYAADAKALPDLIRDNYAYLDDLPGGKVPSSPQLDAERDAVHDSDSLLHYAEDMIIALADSHALTAKSFKDDWAIVPSYSDLWIDRSGGFRVGAVREDSPAAAAGIEPGDVLVSINGMPPEDAVKAFWGRLGLPTVAKGGLYDNPELYAIQVLVAGRRDRPRKLAFTRGGQYRAVTLDNLYTWSARQPDRPALTVSKAGGVTTIRFNNSIGDLDTIKAFDTAMAAIPARAPIVIDLTDTPSGGTSAIARAIMGWFIAKPMPYQMHQLPSEERETGIKRQWVEYVLPRPGKYHPGPVSVRAGHWTGSMGEGLAVGFMALGKPVCGSKMAGLKGGVYDFDLPRTGLRVKFPAERIYTIAGQPRQNVALKPCR
jgi:carboxyl-terminal processing protease